VINSHDNLRYYLRDLLATYTTLRDLFTTAVCVTVFYLLASKWYYYKSKYNGKESVS